MFTITVVEKSDSNVVIPFTTWGPLSGVTDPGPYATHDDAEAVKRLVNPIASDNGWRVNAPSH